VSTLEKAIRIAAEAHAGQLDKAGKPYVLHCVRVMIRGSTIEENIVGVLHDVVEDTGWSYDSLRQAGFSEDVVQAVAALTRQPEMTYEDFISQVARNPIARRVKLFDLEDNMDLSRLENPTDEDLLRREKYQAAYRFLKMDERV
jgi:(p)ppGpp synthase/HD superfamily hydrolase